MVQLDAQQKQVVETDFPCTIVAAQAGSGKTRCIIERIKFLLSNGYKAKNIYAITYTNAAAEEMRNRINNNADVFIGTIHSLANRILIQNGIDTKWILETENFDMLFEEFKKRKEDIIFPEIDYLLVDEFQDICDNEYLFIFEILNPREFMVVGDSCQSIFSFKGSNFFYFMDMIDNPNIHTFELNNCYRCGMDIIDFAETFLCSVDDVYKIPVFCKSGIFGTVNYANFSIDGLLEEIENSGYEYKDIFILTRTNREIEEIKYILDKYEIPNDTFKKSDLDLGGLNEILLKNSIKILTVHSAKGLEAKKVIVIGVKPWNNEEKRIAYVAATRAIESLVWLTEKKKPKKRPQRLMSWE